MGFNKFIIGPGRYFLMISAQIKTAPLLLENYFTNVEVHRLLFEMIQGLLTMMPFSFVGYFLEKDCRKGIQFYF